MPQTKVEKKFFRVYVGRELENIESLIYQNPAVFEFQEVQINIAEGEKPFPTKLAGGEE